MAKAIAIKAPAEGHAIPVVIICAVIVVIWYLACIPMNWVITGPKIAAAGAGRSMCWRSPGTSNGR